MTTRYGKVVTQCKRLQLINSYNPLNMCSQEIRDKLITYLHYHNAYGHKAYQGGDIPEGAVHP